jgi:hypothetical protein
MYENGTMTPFETSKKRERRDKENDGGGEYNLRCIINIFVTITMYHPQYNYNMLIN